MHPKTCASCLSTFFAILACAGCTPLFSKNPDQWRDARVASIVSHASIPAGVDDHCLGMPGDDADKGKVAIIAIHLGRRMASYRLAMPISDGRRLIHVGDNVIVKPQPCKLEIAGTQAD